jgi:hypothetical protein
MVSYSLNDLNGTLLLTAFSHRSCASDPGAERAD